MKKNTIHRLDGLNNRHLFLTVREAGKSKIEVLANWVLGWVFLACRWLLSHCVLAGQKERVLVSLPLLKRAVILSWRLHPDDFIYT